MSRLLALSTLVILALSALAGPALAAPAAQDGLPCAQMLRHPVSGQVQTLRDCPVGAQGSPDQVALAFLRQFGQQLGLSTLLDDLQLLDVAFGLGSSHVRFQQTYRDLPVYGAYLSVHFASPDKITALHSRVNSDLSVDLAGATLSAQEAEATAREAIGFVQARGPSPDPQQVIFVPDGATGRVAWLVTLLAAEPQGDWEVLVDAGSGQVIKRYNRLVLDQGQVFSPNPAQKSGRRERGNPWPELQAVELLGLDGSGWLRGEYADLTSPTGYRPAAAFEADGDFRYAPDDPRFEEVMVYYHVDATQRYVQSLGYSDGNTPANGIRDRATQASAHWFAQDQSFYSASDDALHFGDGGVEDAEDADIIVHEYAHALQHDQVACWGGGDTDAIGEGFGDYLAASRFADAGEDAACIGEWDSQSYADGPPFCLRRVDEARRYPQDLTGDPHLDGEVWSRALWDMRTALGAQVADTLALESNFYLPCAATLPQAAAALLDADGGVFGGAHRDVLLTVLAQRGLLALPAPTLWTPNGGETFFPGDQMDVIWQLDHDLPVTYEVQVTLTGEQAAIQRFDFSAARLPEGFDTFGSRPWQAADGALRAGPVDHNGGSSLTYAVELNRPGRLSFRYRVSSEPGWDRLEFLLDGQPALTVSGERGWSSFETTLAAGSHSLVWRYLKDGTVSQGQDSAWLDDLVVEQASLAEWSSLRPIEGELTTTYAVWPVPEADSSAARVRVRARLGDLVSAWDTSDRPFAVGNPLAVTVSDFQAAASPAAFPQIPLVPWGVVGLLLAVGVGAGLGSAHRRR